MKKIIDVSSYQSNIDWSKVVADGVIIKAGEALFKDSSVGQHTLNARAKGLKVSYYYFAHPNNSPSVSIDAENAADYFSVLISAYNQPDFQCGLDIEVNPNGLTPDEMEEWILSFISKMGTHGVSMMIYGSPYFLDQNLPANHSLGTTPLWLSEYNGQDKPTVLPIGWSDYLLWQYTDREVNGGYTVDTSLAKDELY